jgi:hypothetical protein
VSTMAIESKRYTLTLHTQKLILQETIVFHEVEKIIISNRKRKWDLIK